MSRFADFRAGLLDPAVSVPDGLLDDQDEPTLKRYGVYRNNVTVSLIEAMKSAFPLVSKLIGPQTFERLAGVFVREHPPKSPVMMFYGAEFPSFLEGFAPLSHIGYLPDSARLDLALRASYHAANAPSLEAARLAQLPEEVLINSTFTLAPSTRVIRSQWPLYDIWRFNQSGDAPKPRSIAQDIIITREEFDPVPHPLPLGGGAWLQALADGMTFGQANDAASADASDFDLTAILTLALTTRAFADIHHKDLP